MNRCKTCFFWSPADSRGGGYCDNEKIHETDGQHHEGEDHLIYSYNEGGSFWAGPEFGCVHHSPAEDVVAETSISDL
jgi:hypothetical protein